MDAQNQHYDDMQPSMAVYTEYLVDGNWVYLAIANDWPLLNGHLKLINIQNINSPEEIGTIQINDEPTAVFKHKDSIYVSTSGSGIYIFDQEILTSIHNDKLNISNFCLYQNYPNPFNPSTIINYELRTNSDVKLVVYDILGREIKTLVDKVQNAGSYNVTFDASSLASGVYYYRLISKYFNQTRKMLLLR